MEQTFAYRLVRQLGALCLWTTALVCSYAALTSGVQVTIRNVDTQPLTQVAVIVRGQVLELGTIEPGEAKTIRVETRRETSLGLMYASLQSSSPVPYPVSQPAAQPVSQPFSQNRPGSIALISQPPSLKSLPSAALAATPPLIVPVAPAAPVAPVVSATESDDDDRRFLEIGGYLEPGYKGFVYAEVARDRITRMEDRTRTGPL